MASIKLNNGNNGKVKIGTKKTDTGTKLNLGSKKTESVEEIEEPKVPLDTGMPEPIKEPEFEDKEQNTYMEVPDKDDLIDEEDEEDLKSKKGKCKKKNKKKEKKPKDNKPETVEARYKAYITRKYITIGSLVLIALALLFFGVFNTFFKHTLTEDEAAAYTNGMNGQTQVQQWDSGVIGYLQTNLKTILATNSGDDPESFSVDNIAVERNLQLSADTLLSFFSADVTAKGKTDRIMFELPIKIVDNKYTQAGSLSISMRESFTSDSSTISANEFLDFPGKADEAESSAFKIVLENFLTLGYNDHQDVSNIYKGNATIDFTGKFIDINSCSVYSEPNELGYNALVSYTLQLPSGFKYTTTNYMTVAKEGSSYVIEQII